MYEFDVLGNSLQVQYILPSTQDTEPQPAPSLAVPSVFECAEHINWHFGLEVVDSSRWALHGPECMNVGVDGWMWLVSCSAFLDRQWTQFTISIYLLYYTYTMHLQWFLKCSYETHTNL